jgi:hypothetical protein
MLEIVQEIYQVRFPSILEFTRDWRKQRKISRERTKEILYRRNKCDMDCQKRVKVGIGIRIRIGIEIGIGGNQEH